MEKQGETMTLDTPYTEAKIKRAAPSETPLSTSQTHFPFSALEGQHDLQTALILCAVEPLIGGVLIEGPRGTAKSTAARGLSELLDKGDFVNLPLSASEEQLLGSLDIETVLRDGEVNFKPGLLSAAHQGVLYVDEVNLLADHLVDALLDVSASGINRIERDGISHQHAARFVLIGTMNPEEGQLRPQLLDRFGLYLKLPATIEPQIRQRIVQARLAFDADTAAFISRFKSQQQTLQQRIVQARSRVKNIEMTEAVMARVAEICYQARVEGVRADLTLLRAAAAHAAWQGRCEITDEDIARVQPWVLVHRQNQQSSTHASDLDGTEQQHQTPGMSSTEASQPSANQPQSPLSSRSTSSPEDWGAMPAEAPAIAPLKPLKPMPLKKP